MSTDYALPDPAEVCRPAMAPQAAQRRPENDCAVCDIAGDRQTRRATAREERQITA